MKKIQYIIGDATKPQYDVLNPKHRYIVHICNDVGAWGAGFVMAISRMHKLPEQMYRAWHSDGDNFKLGEIQVVDLTGGLSVINMIAQSGIRASVVGRGEKRPPIRYKALGRCLSKVREHCGSEPGTIHMPRIGTGLGGGSWEMVEPVIREELCQHNIEVFVYDPVGTTYGRNKFQEVSDGQ